MTPEFCRDYSHLNSGGTRQQALGEGVRAGGGPRNNSALVGELAEEPLTTQAGWSRHRCVLRLHVPANNKGKGNQYPTAVRVKMDASRSVPRSPTSACYSVCSLS